MISSKQRGVLAGLGAVAATVFVLMLLGYQQSWTWVDDMDDAAIDAFAPYGQAHPGWVTANVVVSTVFGPMSFRLLGTILLLVALARRSGRIGLFLVLTVGFGGLVNEIVKRLTARPRPTEQLVDAFSLSFPSGHSFGVVVGVLAIGTVLWPHVRRNLRPVLIGVAVLLVLAVGFSRVALVVHHVSDVLAGYSWGFLWWAVCFVAVRPDRAVLPLRKSAVTETEQV